MKSYFSIKDNAVLPTGFCETMEGTWGCPEHAPLQEHFAHFKVKLQLDLRRLLVGVPPPSLCFLS